MAGIRLDPVAASAAVIAGAMLVVYLSIIRHQGGDPAAWAIAALLIGAASAGYSAFLIAPRRRFVLALGGVLLLGTGVLAILTIGLPIVAAGGLSLAAAFGRPRTPTGPEELELERPP